MPHCLHECVLFNQTPIGALYPPHEWRGFTAHWKKTWKKLYNDFTVIEAVLCFRGRSNSCSKAVKTWIELAPIFGKHDEYRSSLISAAATGKLNIKVVTHGK